jgi:heme/copper-type cytochrome/quinol oxidase subunit 1
MKKSSSKNPHLAAKKWAILGIIAIALSGVFSILLILGRTTDLLGSLPAQDFFKTAIILHVNLSVLVWLSCALLSYLNFLNPPKTSSFNIAAIATALIAISPFIGGGEGYLNNYIPIFDNNIFKFGIALYLFAFISELVLVAAKSSNVFIRSIEEITALAFISLAVTTFPLLGQDSTHALYESLFWSFGHLLQFTYTFAMLLAWQFLLKNLGGNLYVGEKLQRAFVAILFITTAAIFFAYEVESGRFVESFTHQMIVGGLITVPYIFSLARHLWSRNSTSWQFKNVGYVALFYSLILFVLGGVLGSYAAKTLLIDGDITTIIPAHYHGSTIAVTVAFMGLIYVLMPKLGGRTIKGKLPLLQLHLYCIGQIMYIIGLAILGGHGAARKTVGIGQIDVAPIVTHIMRGGGGLLMIGGLLFVWIIARAFWKKK